MKCPNEGLDRRALHWLICPLQWLCSWHSEKPPAMRVAGATAWCYWPPYFVTNAPRRCMHFFADPDQYKSVNATSIWFIDSWRLFRIGWRYDKNWLNPQTGKKGGYIGPSAAFKIVDSPLLFY